MKRFGEYPGMTARRLQHSLAF